MASTPITEYLELMLKAAQEGNFSELLQLDTEMPRQLITKKDNASNTYCLAEILELQNSLISAVHSMRERMPQEILNPKSDAAQFILQHVSLNKDGVEKLK